MFLAESSRTVWSDNFRWGFSAYINEDYKTAFHKFESLANNGNVRAQFYLGSMYETGNGIKKDLNAALHWYGRSAEQGNVDALWNLGLMYAEGTGVKKNYNIALKWFGLAAKQGDFESMYNMGWIYQNPETPSFNNIQAYKWYHIAASLGFKRAITSRNLLAKEMSTAEIEKAQRLALQCARNKFQSCEINRQ